MTNRSEPLQMITTAAQYRTTEAWAATFEAEADEREAVAPAPRTRPQQARIDAARSLAASLRQELVEYLAARSRAATADGAPR